MNISIPPLEIPNENEKDLTSFFPGEFTNNDNEEGLIDITQLITECSSSLSHTNPLLHIPSFSLMDSMSALVLMDPSMDSCQNLTKMRKAPTSLSDLKLWDEVSFQNVKEYSHEILIRLNAFLSGCGVAESTFTCLYAHDNVLEDMRDLYSSHKISDAQSMLYATTLLYVKLCINIRSTVQHADIYEEEDFVMNAYNFRFFPNYVNEDELTETVNNTLKKIMLLQSGNEDLKSLWLCLGYLWNFYKCCNSLVSYLFSLQNFF